MASGQHWRDRVLTRKQVQKADEDENEAKDEFEKYMEVASREKYKNYAVIVTTCVVIN